MERGVMPRELVEFLEDYDGHSMAENAANHEMGLLVMVLVDRLNREKYKQQEKRRVLKMIRFVAGVCQAVRSGRKKGELSNTDLMYDAMYQVLEKIDDGCYRECESGKMN
mgnify:CR=1 FL=1